MKVLIAGAGIGGLTAAIALQRAGHEVQLAERAPELKAVGAGIALAANAISALKSIGAGEEVIAAGSLIDKALILSRNGNVISANDFSHPSGKMHTYTLHRAELHELLRSKLLPGTLHTGKTVSHFSETAAGIVLHFTDNSAWQGDLLLAADGIHSTIRRQLLPHVAHRYAGYTCWRGVTAATVDTTRIAFSETWDTAGRFGICPLTNNRVYWYACINTSQENDPRFAAWKLSELQNHFAGFHYPVSQLLAATPPAQLMHNDIIDLKPLQSLAYGRVLLLGDAGHATTPNLGQGACQAIEDAVLLPAYLTTADTVEQSLRSFSAMRLPRTSRIVEESLRVGKLAQTDSRLLAAMRNALMRILPSSLASRQFQFLYDVSFPV
ncbi:MAG: FAD-dependent monooxygenase [Bacteroidetes bacterium]|nr:FAD-dependent monooxygenase [Bacteroidota bacterium]